MSREGIDMVKKMKLVSYLENRLSTAGSKNKRDQIEELLVGAREVEDSHRRLLDEIRDELEGISRKELIEMGIDPDHNLIKYWNSEEGASIGVNPENGDNIIPLRRP